VLIDSYFETERARKHVEESKAAVQDFLNTGSCAVSVEEGVERNVKRFSSSRTRVDVSDRWRRVPISQDKQTEQFGGKLNVRKVAFIEAANIIDSTGQPKQQQPVCSSSTFARPHGQ
jgi:hypothetical protein